MMPLFLTASLLLLLIITLRCSAYKDCCYESLLLPAGCTDFDIRQCPKICFQCPDKHIVLSVAWFDEQNRHGRAVGNTDETYKVLLKDPTFPGHYKVSIIFEYLCLSPSQDFSQFFTTEKTLNVYGAKIVHYYDEQTGVVKLMCSTGITGSVNSGITMNTSFTGDDNHSTCSATCSTQIQVPCNWNSVAWIKRTGTCTVIVNATTSNSGTFCCEVNSQVIACKHVSVTDERTTTPLEKHGSQPSGIIVGSVLGGACLFVMVVIVAGIAVFYWRRHGCRHRGYGQVADNQRGGDGGHPDRV